MHLKKIRIFFFALLLSIFFGCSSCEKEKAAAPPTGRTPRQSFEKVITGLISKWNIRGGAVGLVKDERLVLAEGYGLADKDKMQSPGATSLFRTASLSKPITAVAILKLYEDGLLRLEEKAFRLIDDLKPPSTPNLDPRIYDITIRDLLQHSGGWDRNASFDPMFKSLEIAQALGVQPPATSENIIRFMLNKPLDFTPGSRYAYSNFGYCVLGRVIERMAGQSYEEFVKTNILMPMGISSVVSQ